VLGLLKQWALVALSMMLAGCAIPVMFKIVGVSASDAPLLMISVLPCLAIVAWGLTGARPIPEFQTTLILLPGFTIGLCLRTLTWELR
jgi:hypothetical protein